MTTKAKGKPRAVSKQTKPKVRFNGLGPNRLYNYDVYKHGTTQSMIALWLECREQCRLYYLEGWTPKGVTPFYFVYGSLVHWCLEQLYQRGSSNWTELIHDYPDNYFEMMSSKKGQSQAELDEIAKARDIAAVVLPEYVKRIRMSDSLYCDQRRKWLDLESVTAVALKLPNNEYVPLRGMLDAVFVYSGAIGEDSNTKPIWVLDTKTGANPNVDGLVKTLPKDLQMMTYLSMLRLKYPNRKVGGCLYNLIARPGLRQGKKESWKEYVSRVQQHVRDNPNNYFNRLEMSVTNKEIDHWIYNTLRKIVGTMALWCGELERNGTDAYSHYYNPTAVHAKYGSGPCSMFDAMCGHFAGYRRRKVPFQELEL